MPFLNVHHAGYHRCLCYTTRQPERCLVMTQTYPDIHEEARNSRARRNGRLGEKKVAVS
jgi:hypothetical protein